MNICILLGGESSERRVSLVSGLAVGTTCRELGHAVWFLDPATGEEERARDLPPAEQPFLDLVERWERLVPDPGLIPESLARVRAAKPDCVLILLHGGAGEGGTVQALFDLWQIPYSGSGHVASAVAMDKVVTKRILERLQIPVAAELLWTTPLRGPCTPPTADEIAGLGGYPIVAKPIAGGSTLGVTIVRDPSMWTEAWRNAKGEIDPDRGLLLEQFIPGQELTVGLLDGQPLPVVEIRPGEGFYDYRSKYTAGASQYIVPADVPTAAAERMQEWAARACAAIGVRDVARVDFRLAPDGRIACLEVNTIPGMTPTSLVPKAAKAIGIEFTEVVSRLIARATARGRAAA